jgi:hypothetical protein
MTKTKYIATTKEWRDKVNGNSYFSTRIEDIENDKMYILPFQYGYGDQSEYETKKVINYVNGCVSWSEIKFIKIDRCLKKEVTQHGTGSEHNYYANLGFYYQD